MKQKEKNKGREAIKNNLYALKLMWSICKKRVIHNALSQVVGYFEWLFYSAFFMRYVINALETDQEFVAILLFVVITIAVFASISLYNAYLNGKLEPETQITINKGLNLKLFQKSRNVELSCFEDEEFYNKYTLAMDQATERLVDTVKNIFGMVFGVIATVISFLLLYEVDPWSVAFVAFPIIGNFVFNKVIAKIEFDRNKDFAPHNRKIAYVNRVMYLEEYAKEMRLTNAFALMKRHYKEAIKGLVDETHKYVKKGMIFHWLRVTFTFNFIFEGLLLYGAYRALVSQTVSLAQLAVITSMMVSSTWILIGFTESLMAGFKNGLFIWNLRSFLEYKETIPEDYDGMDPGKEIQTIEFRNVSFSYKDQPVLSHLSFEIRGGKTYALVGHNGAGKSTIIKLLMRFYDPTEGEILLNGRNVKKYNLQKYRALFASAFQDCRIFSLSVYENVLMRKLNSEPSDRGTTIPSLTDQTRVEQALKLAGVYDKVMTLPKGCDTILTREFADDGAVLSGGEFQKIGVARAFVRDCPVKIFDEPSSALDPISEYKLFDNILKSSQDKTVLFISHRLSSVQNADWVLMLQDGAVIEEGTHKMLMKKQGIYADMYQKQAENYLAVSAGEVKDGIFSMEESDKA